MTPIDARTLKHVDFKFIQRMDDELEANQSKGEWKAWQPSPSTLSDELVYHAGKLERALGSMLVHSSPGAKLKAAAEAQEYAADLANYALKGWELAQQTIDAHKQ